MLKLLVLDDSLCISGLTTFTQARWSKSKIKVFLYPRVKSTGIWVIWIMNFKLVLWQLVPSLTIKTFKLAISIIPSLSYAYGNTYYKTRPEMAGWLVQNGCWKFAAAVWREFQKSKRKIFSNGPFMTKKMPVDAEIFSMCPPWSLLQDPISAGSKVLVCDERNATTLTSTMKKSISKFPNVAFCSSQTSTREGNERDVWPGSKFWFFKLAFWMPSHYPGFKPFQKAFPAWPTLNLLFALF